MIPVNGSSFGTRRWSPPPIPGRYRERQHLGYCPRVNPQTAALLPVGSNSLICTGVTQKSLIEAAGRSGCAGSTLNYGKQQVALWLIAEGGG